MAAWEGSFQAPDECLMQTISSTNGALRMTPREEMNLLAEQVQSSVKRLDKEKRTLQALLDTSTRFKPSERIHLAATIECCNDAMLRVQEVHLGVCETIQLMMKHNV